jgi:hypothetical protein
LIHSLSAVKKRKAHSATIPRKGANIADSKSKIQNIQKGYAIESRTPVANDSSLTDLVAQIKTAFAEARDSNNAVAMRRYMRDRFDFIGLTLYFDQSPLRCCLYEFIFGLSRIV